MPAPDTAILLCNLGTPDAPTTPAVREYLAEFLHDPRVVEIPRVIWCPILHGIILRTRPAQSARRYASIWRPEGSPLTIWTDKQAKLLAGYLGERGHKVTVRFAMRYRKPSIASVLDELKAGGARRVLVLPMYPQYCAATTASVADAVYAWGKRERVLPEIRFVNRFHDDPRYIDALAKRLSDHWMTHGRGERLVMSFHGMPKRTQKLGDPYFDECMETARLVAARADVKPDKLVVTFQSRLGRAEWLKPYTEPTLVQLAKQGVKKVDVMCPGFVADNLETLEEIAQEARDAFLKAGGTDFNYVPCLNDQHEWMAALTALALRHLQGWDTQKLAPVTIP
ncbi:ferrochelatase [Piscinibacter sp. HJYY11]|uniref:ferrochelatase n=1 Tax=Piscinibacter sp. HJYY11 TaxID=2801333 RepID=UPI00191FB1F8|nr:ferrochelatase [Piscinibacter sp. HJYY11]MBL0726731.1 ferrochelatase [Piscinibacter sp. HJYY11]